MTPHGRAGDSLPIGTASVRRLATRLSKLAWVALVGVAAFNTVSAIGGAIAMLFTNGLGMPRALLVGSPFASFVVPAVLLLAVVGGTQAVAAVLLLLRRPSALCWATFAGFTMVTWILVETAIIRGFGLLQALYYLTGVAELVLVFALLGIVSWMPRVGRAGEYERASAAHG
ncbi:hypothetical protein [Amnibacterium sp.]|uniref:hypothetical protein n=1 Tax=Amnibacterium sp. TaxID=1872496 RepID=UPI002606A605|nr:hypothetical protein [Amnibacterium sp.]MCU1472110.1 hypothetical protein [Amnibacterium sp.]